MITLHELVTVQPMTGPTDLVFQLKLLSKEESDQFDLTNPHRICGGKWGGMGGTQQWFMFKDRGKVYEEDSQYSTDNLPEGYTGRTSYFWKRVWDNDAQCWREITLAELTLLPKREDRLWKPIVFDKFTFPMIKGFS